MTATVDLRGQIVAAGMDAGLDRVGVTSAEPFPETRSRMEERLSSGASAGLKFTYKDPDRATDVTLSFPWARRLVVGIRSYLPESGHAPVTPGHGRIARFAIDDPYGPLRRGLEALSEVLSATGHRAEILIDDDRLMDRAAAVRAGVGWWGKSTMVLTPGLGPWFVVGSIVTDAELPIDAPMARGCGTCDACLPACPTGALVAPGVLDARRCLAALAQSPGVIPREWRSFMGDRLYGCDDCLDACPPGTRLRDTGSVSRGTVDLEWLLSAADATVLERFSHFYLPGRTPRILRRNGLVAMGNSGDVRHRITVARHVGHHDWLLRAHAAWAFPRVDPVAAGAVLGSQLERERHPTVREELELALAG